MIRKAPAVGAAGVAGGLELDLVAELEPRGQLLQEVHAVAVEAVVPTQTRVRVLHQKWHLLQYTPGVRFPFLGNFYFLKPLFMVSLSPSPSPLYARTSMSR